MSQIECQLRAKCSPICSTPDVAIAIGITPSALFQRLRNYPELTRPPTFLAGGRQMMMVDSAVAWAEKHVAEWTAKGRG